MGEIVQFSRDGFIRPKDLDFACTDDDLLYAIRLWLEGEDPKVVADLLGTVSTKLTKWCRLPGWKFLEECLRDDVRAYTHSILGRLTHKSLKMLEDRLEHGDPIYDADGSVLGYRPIRAKDLALIQATLLDRQHEIEKRLAGAERDEALMTLQELAESLRAYSKAKPIEGRRVG